MRRSEVIHFFSTHRDDLRRLGIIAEFDRPIGHLGLARVQHELERLLGCGVDLATPGTLRKGYRDRIYAEAVRAA